MASVHHVFGIRHHGPGSARSVLAALEALAPDCVLIEGPPEADSIVHLAREEGMSPPVALLVFVPDQPRRSVYYPFAEFSPEWQAIGHALTRNVAVRFMDLPQTHQLAEQATPPDPASTEPAPPPDPDEAFSMDDKPCILELHQQRDPVGLLARAAGYTDSERWWDHMVEHRRDPAGVFEAVLEAMTELRSAGLSFTGPGRDVLNEQRREAFMRQTIRQAKRDGFERIAVVCGAWHAPALVDLPKVAEDAALLKEMPKVKVSATWIPWTHSRLTFASGYGAGIESPGWYQHLWSTESGVSELWMTRVARHLRDQDLDASPAAVIEAVRLAETLAAMQNRAVPGLAEMNEATRAVLCFGSNLPLSLIANKLIVGEVLGAVPDSAPAPPLRRDLTSEQKRLRLAPEVEPRVLDLDLRKPNDLDRSQLLHRLNLLGTPWGRTQRESGNKGTFHEVWQLQWKPEFAVALIEAGIYGNTVFDAATQLANERAGKFDLLPSLTQLLDQVLLSGLPGSATHIVTRIEAVAAVASDIAHLMAALPPLASVLRYGNVRKTDPGMVGHVVNGLVARICIGLPGACSSLDDDAAEAMYEHLRDTHASIALLQDDEFTAEWQAALTLLSQNPSVHGLVAGRATRILADAGAISGDGSARRMGLAFSSEPHYAGAWVDGFLRGSGLLLLHDDSLWQVLDTWVCALPAETFDHLLPLLRRTFGGFHAPERRQMGERVRGRRGEMDVSPMSTGFDEAAAHRALMVVRQLLGLPPALTALGNNHAIE